MSRYNRGRGRTPSIYRNLGSSGNVDKASICDYRFSSCDDSKAGTSGSAADKEDDDPFQSCLNEFLKQEQIRKGQQCENGKSNFQGFHPYQHPTKEFPQDKPHFCDKCFRGYNTLHMYQQHLETHIKCTYEGCKFEANAWFLAKHITNVHEMGISLSGSQARNDKWVQERKRNFPSRAAVEEKEKDAEEKVNRGDVLVATNKFGRFKIEAPPSQSARPTDKQETVGVVAVDQIQPQLSSNKSENIEELPFSAANSKEEAIFDSNTENRLEKLLEVVKDGPEQLSKKNNWNRNFVKQEKSSLLEQLLKDDIVHERNLLLQCIRHIVSNNFFDSDEIQ